MVVSQETHPGSGALPEAFRAAAAGLHEARLRPEISCEEMPAPQRIAPYATALSADVTVDGTDQATGRLILLHDPAGNDAWEGTYRCVAYVRADVERDLVSDGLITGVAWSWLTEALEAHDARHLAISGTVTTVATDSFGGMADEDGTAQIEIRASWTPCAVDGTSYDAVPDLRRHAEAWGELLGQAAGLEPVPDGVTAIPSRRGQRGR